MDTQPTNSTGSPSNLPPSSDNDPDDPPPSSTPPPPPPSSSTNPPPDESSSDPTNQSPSQPSQDLLDDPPPSASPPPPSQDSSQNSPAPPINTQPINSSPAHPSSPSQNSPAPPINTQPINSSSASQNSLPPPPSVNLSRSQPPTLSQGAPPGGQHTSNPPTLPPPSPFPTSPVLPETPTISGSNNVIQKSDSNTAQIRSVGLIAIGLVFGFVFLGIIGVAVWCILRRMKKVAAEEGLPTSLGASPQSDYGLKKMLASPAKALFESGHESVNGSAGLGNSRTWLSYEELVRATNEFSERNLLGEGGFGSVFKGRLKDGREVAVKQLKDGGGQGEREFRAEVETISRIHHRHLVSLVGFCISDEKRLLVYDYVPNNTLHFHLHGQSEHILDWPTRIKIATGAARGIAYLHVDCHPRIVHRDIKSSNILLDNNFEAQVSDFGLARWFSDLNTHVTTRVMGTFGYMAPEYALSGKLTEKSDVFSFGVVLLELVTGRKPVDSSQPPGEQSLVEWAQPLLNDALDKEEFKKLVDPRLENNYVDSEMFRVIEAAAACVQYSALKRPKMSQILRVFDDMSVSDVTNMIRVGEIKIVDTAQKSEEISLFRRMAFGTQDYSTSTFIRGDFKSEAI